MKLSTHAKKMKKKKRIKGDLGFDIVSNIIAGNHEERRREREMTRTSIKTIGGGASRNNERERTK